MMIKNIHTPSVAIIGGGPAGLFAAEIISKQGYEVHIFDSMPSVGRKFLLAGIGGLNISHSEPFDLFCSRYLPTNSLTSYLKKFGTTELLEWCYSLGIETFIGSSGRIFPKEMKAAPLLRAWLKRLREQKVTIHPRHTWQGWEDEDLIFNTPMGKLKVKAAATLLTLGGASYPRLGSNGKWLDYLTAKHITAIPWQPSNCGFETQPWSAILQTKYAGMPVKQVSCFFIDADNKAHYQLGELLISHYGLEGNVIYALSSKLRDSINQQGKVTLYIDLYPQYSLEKLQQRLTKQQGSQSISNFLRKQINLKDIKMGLVRELAPEALQDIEQLPRILKALPITLLKPRPITEAISSAGGICLNEINHQMMLTKLPSIFCAGEMLDWDAPTGGYLLTGCFSMGYCAGQGVIDYLSAK